MEDQLGVREVLSWDEVGVNLALLVLGEDRKERLVIHPEAPQLTVTGETCCRSFESA
jgi:hypothetical protein